VVTVKNTDQESIRSRVTFDEIEGLRITIPARTPYLPALLMLKFSASTVAFVAVGWLTYRALVFLRSHDLAAFKPPIWLLLWALICTCLAISWAVESWKFHCREIIQIGGDDLMLRAEGYFLVHRPKRVYLLSEIRNLRYEPAPLPWGDRSSPSSGLSIAFDYLGSTERFGLSLSLVESGRLIRTIKDRYKIADDKDEPLPVERL
jgi:hypothetical protein